MFRFSRILTASLLTTLFWPVGAAPAETPELPPREEILSPTPAYARNQEVIAETRRLVQAEDTAGLEALADELRRSRARLDGGTWMLSSFYKTACSLPSDPEQTGRVMDFFRRWARERPDSVTAQVCLAAALTNHAWQARGGGWADSVTDEGWRLFANRLDEALAVLERAATLEEKCPAWTEVAQRVALGQGWDRDRYLEMVNTAIRQEPTYGRYYTNTAYWMTPRWNGEPGDLEQWIAQTADLQPEADRDRHYAFLVWMADRMPVGGEIVFAPDRLDWDRTQRGLARWAEEEPENLMVSFQWLRLALLADDREAARRQFDRIGGKYFPDMWNDAEEFESARLFAYADGPNPFFEDDEEITLPTFPPEALAATRVIFRAILGLCGGVLVGTLLLILAVQRGQVWVGLAALLLSVLLATPFGTLATTIPAAALFLFLRRKTLPVPPERPPSSGGIVLLWTLVLAGALLGLQIAATIWITIPLLLEHGLAATDYVTQLTVSNGSSLTITISSCWICFLALVAVCRPNTRTGWNTRLGLFPCRPGPAVVWSVVVLLTALGIGYLLEPLMDEKTRETLKLLALGLQSPVFFYLSIALAAPIFEELLFRGYAYSGWIPKLGFPATALVTTILFTVCHFHYGWVALLSVFLLGLMLAVLRWKTGSVFPCIGVHVAYNLVYCLTTQFFPAP